MIRPVSSPSASSARSGWRRIVWGSAQGKQEQVVLGDSAGKAARRAWRLLRGVLEAAAETAHNPFTRPCNP
jgi:hypothetical protein